LAKFSSLSTFFYLIDESELYLKFYFGFLVKTCFWKFLWFTQTPKTIKLTLQDVEIKE